MIPLLLLLLYYYYYYCYYYYNMKLLKEGNVSTDHDTFALNLLILRIMSLGKYS